MPVMPMRSAAPLMVTVVVGLFAAPHASAQEEPPVPPPPPAKEWKFNVILGFTGSFGNTDTQSGSASFTALRAREDTRLSFDTQYFYGASNGDRTDNKLTAGVKHDWLVPDSPWLFFGQGRYDLDEFQSWDYRLGAHGGVGYEFIKEETFTLTGRAGLGAIKEFNSDDDDIKPEALLGGDLTWQISDKQSLAAATTFYPDLDETGEFRNISSAHWSILLDAATALSFDLGVEFEHQSQVDPGIDRNDLRITAGIKMAF